MRLTLSILILVFNFSSLQAGNGDKDYRKEAEELQLFIPHTKYELEELKIFAERGNINAQMSLGFAYSYPSGTAVHEKNLVEAIKWYHKAAEQGSVDAQWNLGQCYDNGEGVAIDRLEAIKWYKKVYYGQNIPNKYLEDYKKRVRMRFSELYLNDEKVKNYIEAICWLREAAQQGSGDALNNLGRCYYNGLGVNKDLVEAFAYFNLSKTNGTYSSNPDYFELLEIVLTPSQLEEGQKRSKQLKVEMENRKAQMERKWWQFWK